MAIKPEAWQCQPLLLSLSETGCRDRLSNREITWPYHQKLAKYHEMHANSIKFVIKLTCSAHVTVLT